MKSCTADCLPAEMHPFAGVTPDLSLVMAKVVEILCEINDYLAPLIAGEKSFVLKSDTSLVTAVDKAIEECLEEKLPPVIPGSRFLGEEDAPDTIGEAAELFSAKYLWVVDPIDGTTNFIFGVPLYAVSIGLFANQNSRQRPLAGALLLPASREIFFSDGISLKRVSLPSREISHVPPPVFSEHMPIFYNESIPHIGTRNVFADLKQVRMLCTSALNILFTALGRGSATCVRACAWDFAGALPMARVAGLELRDPHNGAVLESFAIDDFHFNGSNDNWLLKKSYILSNEEHFLRMQKLLGLEPITRAGKIAN
jgi:fructose-1,6-bisphosphatase/inositol monophosphatase family enzyme